MATVLSKIKFPLLAALFIMGTGTAMALDAYPPCAAPPPLVNTVTYTEPVTYTRTVVEPVTYTRTYVEPVTYTRTVSEPVAYAQIAPYAAPVAAPAQVTTTYTTVRNNNYMIRTANGWIESAYRPVVIGGGTAEYYPVTRYETIRVVDVARPY